MQKGLFICLRHKCHVLKVVLCDLAQAKYCMLLRTIKEMLKRFQISLRERAFRADRGFRGRNCLRSRIPRVFLRCSMIDLQRMGS